MIHVMNPFKMSIAMFRLTALGLEYQAQMMKALTKMPMAPLAGGKEDEERAVTTQKAARKPAARQSRGATKAPKPAARRTRKPSNPPVMPATAGKQSRAEEGDAAENVPV